MRSTKPGKHKHSAFHTYFAGKGQRKRQVEIRFNLNLGNRATEFYAVALGNLEAEQTWVKFDKLPSNAEAKQALEAKIADEAQAAMCRRETPTTYVTVFSGREDFYYARGRGDIEVRAPTTSFGLRCEQATLYETNEGEQLLGTADGGFSAAEDLKRAVGKNAGNLGRYEEGERAACCLPLERFDDMQAVVAAINNLGEALLTLVLNQNAFAAARPQDVVAGALRQVADELCPPAKSRRSKAVAKKGK